MKPSVPFRVALAVFLAGLGMPHVPTGIVLRAQDCTSCEPQRYNYVTPSGSYLVCILSEEDFAWSDDQKNAISHGISTYVGDWFSSAGVNVSFSYEDGIDAEDEGCSGTPDITVFLEPSSDMTPGALAETYFGGTDGRGASIGVDEDELDDGNVDWSTMGAHEMMHCMDFKEVNTSGCETYSIMAGPNRAFPSSIECADSKALTDDFVGESNGGSDYEYPPSDQYEDCWDEYLVTYYYCWDGSQWWDCGEDWEYVDWTCTPPF